MQLRERQPAPRRAQDGEPGWPVGWMRDGARQREQVEHDGPLTERIDVGGLEGQAAPREFGDDAEEMAATLHQDRDGGRFVFRQPALDDVRNARRLVEPAAAQQRVHLHASILARRLGARARRVAHGAGSFVVGRGQHA